MEHYFFEGHLGEVDTRILANYILTKYIYQKEDIKDEIGYTFQYNKVESIKVVANPFPEILLGFDPLIAYNFMATIFKLEPYSEPKIYKVLGLNSNEEYRQKMLPIYERDYKRKKSY